MSVALLSVAGVALDALLGEPQRRHPLVASATWRRTWSGA
jgi:adenosylcobinamide-phosphate synthase